VFVGVWQAISGAFGMYINAILSVATTVGNALKNFFTGLWSGITLIAKTAWNGFKAFFATFLTDEIQGWKNIFNGFVSFFSNLPSNIGRIAGNIGSAIKGGFTDAVNFIKNLPGEALRWGKDIINGIVNGIKSAAGAVGDAVKGVAQNIRSFLHFSTPDEGPLADFPTYMPDMMNTIVSGLNAGVSKVKAAANNVATAMSMAPGGTQAGSSAAAGTSAQSTTNNYSSGPSQIVLINQIDGKEISRQIIPISLGIAQQSRNRGAAIGNVY
jgi:phage-related protein